MWPSVVWEVWEVWEVALYSGQIMSRSPAPAEI